MSKKLLVMGLAIDSRTRKRGSGMKIEAWDPERMEEGAFSTTSANERGAFRFAFDSTWLAEKYANRPTLVRFRAYIVDTLYADTTVECVFQGGEMEHNIDVDFEKPYVAPPEPEPAPPPPPVIAAPPPPVTETKIVVMPAPEVKLPPAPLQVQATLPRALRERGPVAWSVERVVAQVLDEVNERPLAGYVVRCVAEDGSEVALDSTDSDGTFVLTLGHRDRERLDALKAEKLVFRIYSPDGHEAGVTALQLPAAGQALTLKVPGNRAIGSPAIVDVGRIANINLPHGLLRVLTENGVQTLADIRRIGGIASLGRLPISSDHPAIHAIEAHAALSTLSSDLELNGWLIDKGYLSALQIANTPQRDFVGAINDRVGDLRATQVHAAAQAQVAVVDQILTGVQAQAALGIGTTLANATLPADLFGGAGGDALGRTAYLGDLVAAAIRHLRRNSGALSIADLVELSGQPFDLLLARGEEAAQPRTIRLAVEAVRRYLGATLSPAEYLQDAYAELLGRVGTTAEELRLAQHDKERAAEVAARLAIGYDEGRLAALWLRTDLADAHPNLLTEDALERRFGLRSTTNLPLAQSAVYGDTQSQVRRFQVTGAAWGRNTDEDGAVYVRLKRATGAGVRISLYRDRARTQLVAYGESSGTGGMVLLVEQNSSGLSGWMEVQFTAESDAIELSPIPQLAAWRIEALHKQWAVDDGRIEREHAWPIIDPDLIGPDDFRYPYGTSPAFELWRKRRGWVDRLLGELVHLGSAQAMCDSMYKQGAVAYGSSFPSQGWQDATPVAAFADLATDLAQPLRHDRVRARIDHDLGLDTGAFLRLTALLAVERERKLDAGELHEVASILAQSHKRNLWSVWRDEEHSQRLVLSPEQFWPSLTEPEVGVWPPATGAVLVDPARPSDRRPDGLYGRRARYLFASRTAQQKARLDELRSELGKSWGAFITSLLDAGAVDKLTELTTPEGAAKAKETFAALQLDEAQGKTLLALKADPKSWASHVATVTAVERARRLDAAWRDEESNLGLEVWHAHKLRLAPWRASRERRAEWQALLATQLGASTIDPEVIDHDELLSPFGGAACELLNERRSFLDEKRRDYERVRFQSASGLATFDALVLGNLTSYGKITVADGFKAELRTVRSQLGVEREIELGLAMAATDIDALKGQLASTASRPEAERRVVADLCLSVEQFERLLVLRGYAQSGSASAAAGEEIDTLLANAAVVRSVIAVERDLGVGQLVERRLAQLGLDAAGLAELQRMRLVAKHGALAEGDLGPLSSVLLASERRRLGGRWRAEERERGVAISPVWFRVSTDEPRVRHGLTATLRAQFVAAVTARTTAVAAATAQLATEVDAVEGAHLQALLDGIITASTIPGASLKARHGWVERNLRIACTPPSARRESRVEYGAAFLQSLISGALAGELNREPFSLTVAPGDLPQIWRWLGRFDAWQDARSQALYPELHFTALGRGGSEPWLALRAALDGASDGTTVVHALSTFSEALHDIAAIRVEGAAHAITAGGPLAQSARSLLLLVGRSRASGRLYYATVDSDVPLRDGLSEWLALPGLEHHAHLRVLGLEKRANALELCAESLGSLWTVRFDLSRLAWQAPRHVLPAEELTSLVLVEGTPELRVTGRRDDGTVATLTFHDDGSASTQVLVPGLLGANYPRVLQHVEAGERGGVLILGSDTGAIHYRLLGAADDGVMRPLGAGDLVGSSVLGRGIEVWWRRDDVVFRRRITAGARGVRTLEGLSAVSEWVLDVTGFDVKSWYPPAGTFGAGRPLSLLLTSELVDDDRRREVLAALAAAAHHDRGGVLAAADEVCARLSGKSLALLLQSAVDGASLELPWRDDAIELQPPLADTVGAIGGPAPSGTTRRLAVAAVADEIGFVVLERHGKSYLHRRTVEGDRELLSAPLDVVPSLAPPVEVPAPGRPGDAKRPDGWDLGRAVVDRRPAPIAGLAASLLTRNQDAPRSVLRYVEEAFLTAPLAAAEVLFAVGSTREAEAAEAIATVNMLDQFAASWPRIGDWADRPSDRSELTLGRAGALARVLRLRAVERLVDQARVSEGVEQRELYARAAELFAKACPGKRPEGERFSAFEPVVPAAWGGVWRGLRAQLVALVTKDAVDTIFDDVKGTLTGEMAPDVRLKKVSEHLARAHAVAGAQLRLSSLIETQNEMLTAAHEALLNEPPASEAARRAAERTSERYLRDVVASSGIGRDQLREAVDDLRWLHSEPSTRTGVASNGQVMYVTGLKLAGLLPANAELSGTATSLRALTPAPLAGFAVSEPLEWAALRAELDAALLADDLVDGDAAQALARLQGDVSDVGAAVHALELREREPSVVSEARELALHAALANDELAATRAGGVDVRRHFGHARTALGRALAGVSGEYRRLRAAATAAAAVDTWAKLATEAGDEESQAALASAHGAHTHERHGASYRASVSMAATAPAELERFRETGELWFVAPPELGTGGHLEDLQVAIEVAAPLGAAAAELTAVGAGHAQGTATWCGTVRQMLSIDPQGVGYLTLDGDGAAFHGRPALSAYRLRLDGGAPSVVRDVVVSFALSGERPPLPPGPRRGGVERLVSLRREQPEAFELLMQGGAPALVDLSPETLGVNGGAKLRRAAIRLVGTAGRPFAIEQMTARFFPADMELILGGELTPAEGQVSTQRGALQAVIGRTPIGRWELALPSTADVKERLDRGELEDVHILLSF